MAAAKLTLHCDPVTGAILAGAIREYAFAAYPPGGSDCAQVAHAALLDLATAIEAGITPQQHTVSISRRPRAMVRAAINYYYDRQAAETGIVPAAQRALMLDVLHGEPAMQADLEAARERDRRAP